MSRLSPDNVILGLLAVEPGHGYQLLEHFRAPDRLGQIWHLSTSQLYAILKRLEKNGLIAGRCVESEDAPARTEYRLTDTGEQQFDAWLHVERPSASTRRIRTEFLSRLYLARLLDVPADPFIERQRASCRRHLKALVAGQKQAEPGVGLLALELVIAETEVILRWIDRCEVLIPSGAAEPSR
jgi:DNA-binding PadR family transcriptional regulator